MFSKSIFIFGLLALFACQAQAGTYDNVDIDARVAFGIVDDIRNIIKQLNELISGVLGGALGDLGNIIQNIKDFQKQFIDEGISIISNGVGQVAEFISNKTQQAAQLGIDISSCVTGKADLAQQIAQSMTGNLTVCISTTVSRTMEMVQNNLKTVNELVGEATGFITKLTKCILPPSLTCLNNVVQDVSAFLKDIPNKIHAIVKESTELVNDLPDILLKCVTDTGIASVEKFQAIIQEIDTCVQKIFEENTTAAPSTEAPSTEAPVTEAPVTEAPVTEAPVTEAPVTEAPVTEEPATEAA